MTARPQKPADSTSQRPMPNGRLLADADRHDRASDDVDGVGNARERRAEIGARRQKAMSPKPNASSVIQMMKHSTSTSGAKAPERPCRLPRAAFQTGRSAHDQASRRLAIRHGCRPAPRRSRTRRGGSGWRGGAERRTAGGRATIAARTAAYAGASAALTGVCLDLAGTSL